MLTFIVLTYEQKISLQSVRKKMRNFREIRHMKSSRKIAKKNRKIMMRKFRKKTEFKNSSKKKTKFREYKMYIPRKLLEKKVREIRHFRKISLRFRIFRL